MIQRFGGTGSYNLRLSEDVPLPALNEPSCSTALHPVNILRKKVNFMGISGAANSSIFSSNSTVSSPTIICTVHFLDDTQKKFEIQKNATGEDLLSQVFIHLELMEKDFFGLQFISLVDMNCARMRWLDPKKSIKRQIVCPPFQLFFGVKFYVNDPSRLLEEYTRYHFYLQLRKDLLQGPLSCSFENENEESLEMAALLGSFAVQSEFGDFNAEEHTSIDYLTGFQLLTVQSDAMLHKIARLHQLHVGQSPAEAEFNFLAHAKRLPMYGYDLHEAKDGTNHPITIGVNSSGVSVFENSLLVNAFPWAAIIKLSFKRKTFFLRMKTLGHNGDEVDTELSFNAICPQNCKILWKSCIEHHTFFRLIAPPTMANKSLFNLGSKFRYSGRTEFQTMQEMKQRQQRSDRASQRVFHRPLCYSSSGTATPSFASFLPRPSSTSSQTSGSGTHSNTSCHTISTKLQSSFPTNQIDECSKQLALPALMINSITSATTSGVSNSSMAISCTDDNSNKSEDNFYGFMEYSLNDESELVATPLKKNEMDEWAGSGQAKLQALESLLRSVSCSCSRSTSPTGEIGCDSIVNNDTRQGENIDICGQDGVDELNDDAFTHPRDNGAALASTSSSTCSCSSSAATQEKVFSSPTTNLQRRYSITGGDPGIGLYDCVDDIFSASDSEAATSSPRAAVMSSRARLRRRVEMGAALDGALPLSKAAFQQQSAHRKLTYQDLPLCDAYNKFELARNTGYVVASNNSSVKVNYAGQSIPLPTNCKSSLHSHLPCTHNPITTKHLRIRQRIPLTNPRMGSSIVQTPQEVHKAGASRTSTSSSNSICSGSTSTTYKTVGTDAEYGSVGSGNFPFPPLPSSNLNGCQQFPTSAQYNFADYKDKTMSFTNSGLKQGLQPQLSARQSTVECDRREASPYDVPLDYGSSYKLLAPNNNNSNKAFNNGQSCSSLITTNPPAATGSGSYSGVSNPSPLSANKNSSKHPKSSTPHYLMPSTTTTTTLAANNANNNSNAEKFLLQQQLKRLNQQIGSNFQLPATNRYSYVNGGETAGQSDQLLVHPSSRNGNQIYSSEGIPSSKVVESKTHHHHHHRQHSHQKRSQKCTEFPVLVNGQPPQPSASQQLDNKTTFSSFSSANSQPRSHSARKEEVSPRLSDNGLACSTLTSSSRLSMPVVMTTPKVIKLPASAMIDVGEKDSNESRSSGHKPSSAKFLEAVKKTSVQKQDTECLPCNTLVNEDATTLSSPSTVGQIVAVRMSPEAQRHLELGVTGGSDLSHPAIITRIGQNSSNGQTPVTSIPLNEGDQLLKINDRDVGKWTQAEVQIFLKELKAAGNDIVLHIKPNVYRCCSVLIDDEDNNSQTNSQADSTQKKSNSGASSSLVEIQYVADNVPRSDQLAQSLVLLKEAIESGLVVKQFEQLYRKKPGMAMNDSKQLENAGKNRYRDVCPYDSTRVLLKQSPNGDYINACHVNMEIPSSGIVNRYIATQGPLPHTTVDFWHMVWEQSATTIAMLTTLVEKGRVKCHQYWPDQPKETMEIGYGSPLQITNMSERVEAHCHYRELAILHKITKEERLVTQMQYTAWPDHGVPENPQHFIEFVNEVRKARNGSLDPLIVHCSAGIGRTGVLILMETSACQIEANEPVYPLESMRLMRDQRAMLIQTAEQYTFVCESILRAYNEQSVKPMAEYQKCR